jgi:hypothetical protein
MKDLFPQLDEDQTVGIAEVYKKSSKEQDADQSFNESRLYSLKQFKELVLCFFSQS